MRSLSLAFVLLTALPAAAFEFKDGDHVVLVGSTLIEREQRYGFWEAAITARNPDKKITFRNLGWSGDTVWGEARAGFGPVAEGYKHLVDHVRAEKPTVIIVGYGTNESFAGPAGLPKFQEQLKRLLDDLSTTKARFVLLSPMKMVKSPGLPEPAKANENLTAYAEAIRAEANRRSADYLTLLDWMAMAGEHGTVHGAHLTESGYRNLADTLVQSLKQSPPSTLSSEQAEQLRQVIIAKNELYFHRWRPQNITYLTGFRKHEQGNNAREIPQFDPLVAAKEKEIDALKKPQ